MLLIVVFLLALMSLFHSIVGEKFILQRLAKAKDLPEMWGSQQATFRTIQATWHLVSILWLGLAVYLLVVHFDTARAVWASKIIFGVIFGVLAIVPLVWDAGKHKSYIPFGIISVLLFVSALMA